MTNRLVHPTPESLDRYAALRQAFRDGSVVIVGPAPEDLQEVGQHLLFWNGRHYVADIITDEQEADTYARYSWVGDYMKKRLDEGAFAGRHHGRGSRACVADVDRREARQAHELARGLGGAADGRSGGHLANAIHDALPDRWRVGPPTYDPATRRWQVAAIPPNRGRRKVWVKPEYVIGTGDDELAALKDLAERLLASA